MRMTFRPSRLQDWPLTDELEALGSGVLDAAFEVHRELGPGLLESVYAECLAEAMRMRNLVVEREVPVPIHFRGRRLEQRLRLDLRVGGRVIVEVKAVEEIHPIHEAQLLSYLKLAHAPLGYIINFNVPLLRGGIRRRVNSKALS